MLRGDHSFVCAGYFVARIVETPEPLSQGLLPDRVLSVSSCLTEFFPDSWAIEWAKHSDAERVAAASKLGVAAGALPALIRRMTDALSASLLGWPNVWLSLESARRAARDSLANLSEFALLGLGVPDDVVGELASAVEPRSGEAPTGLYNAVSCRTALDPAGEPLGWELLGVEASGTLHSWLCNSIHVLAQSRLGIAPGAFGLMAAEEQARAAAELVAKDASIAEPVPWFPGLIVRYPL